MKKRIVPQAVPQAQMAQVPGPPRLPQAQPQAAQMPQPIKKVKTEGSVAEQRASSAPQSRMRQPVGSEAVPEPKRPRHERQPRQQQQQHVAADATPTPARGGGGSSKNITWALSEVRGHLEEIVDVEGVKTLLDRLPECVLVGGIAARRELVAALLGDHGVAVAAAAQLVAPGLRQPVVLELRNGGDDLGRLGGPQSEAWLQSVTKAMSQALGQRLKTEPLRLRLSAAGCASLDVTGLPDRCTQSSSATTEEICVRHLGSSSSILACLEPGYCVELCRHFDPQLKRTVLLGAAAAEEDEYTAATTLCGSAAATQLERRFAAACRERGPLWLQSLERLEARLSRAQGEAREVERREHPQELLQKARAVGTSFGRALDKVISGAPGCMGGAMTLEEELVEFAAAASKGLLGGDGSILSPQDATNAIADVFANFDGVEGYARYLKDEVRVPCADMRLNGGAAWQRLLSEIEVAMRLAHPPAEELTGLMLNSIRAGGTGVHGHVRWEDVSSKLMLGIAYGPLRRRIRYVVARVIWVLKNQKAVVSEWMATLSDGPAARLYSPLFSEHLQILRGYPVIRDLVFTAFDSAVASVGEAVLRSLEGTLMAACINPAIMLRASTEPSMDPRKAASIPTRQQQTGKAAKAAHAARALEARARVAQEMRKRESAAAGGTGLPVQLLDRVFEPGDGAKLLPFVEVKLRNAFSVLAGILSNQAFAFSDTSLANLCRREVDEAMNKMEGSAQQKASLDARHKELDGTAREVEQRLAKLRHCCTTLRNAGIVAAAA